MRSRCSSVRDERTVSFPLIGIGGSLPSHDMLVLRAFYGLPECEWEWVKERERERERVQELCWCKSRLFSWKFLIMNKSRCGENKITWPDLSSWSPLNVLMLNKISVINHLAGVECPFGSSFCPPYLPTSACRPTLFTYGVQKISLDDGKVWYCTALLSHTSVYVHVIL